MPLELLKELATHPLPRVLTDAAEIDKLRVLHAAELVQADIPAPAAVVGEATVLAVTAQGMHALERAGLHIRAAPPDPPLVPTPPVPGKDEAAARQEPQPEPPAPDQQQGG